MERPFPSAVIWIAVITLIIYLTIMIVFLTVFSNPTTHPITIENQSSQTINLTILGQLYILAPDQVINLNISPQNFTIAESSGTEVIMELDDSTMNNYAVSVQKGFNVAASVKPINNFIMDIDDIFSCKEVTWNFVPGLTGTSANDCPLELQQDGLCISPCILFGNFELLLYRYDIVCR